MTMVKLHDMCSVHTFGTFAGFFALRLQCATGRFYLFLCLMSLHAFTRPFYSWILYVFVCYHYTYIWTITLLTETNCFDHSFCCCCSLVTNGFFPIVAYRNQKWCMFLRFLYIVHFQNRYKTTPTNCNEFFLLLNFPFCYIFIHGSTWKTWIFHCYK